MSTTPSIWGFPASTVTAFDAAYWASQPTAVQALKGASNANPPNGGLPENVILAQQLMQQGYTIDVPVMVWQFDPYMTMYLREFVDGFSWVPSAGQAPGGGTGIIPPGAIKVSTNLADYPPFNPPPIPVQPPLTNPIGPDMGFQMGATGVGAPFNAPCEVFSCSATDPNPVGYIYKSTAGAMYLKYALGSELMSPTQRVCVWLEAPSI